MICHIRGTLVEAAPLRAVIECNGLGYELHIPVTTAERLPSPGSEVMLHTVVVYREDDQTLYGFASREDRDFFVLITEKVSGVGPRIALSILSRLSLPVLRTAIASGDVGLLAKCPGIGRKTAERLCVELRDKMGIAAGGGDLGGAVGTAGGAAGSTAAGAAVSSPVADAVAALMALGYKADVADKAVRKAASALGSGASTEELIRAALR